ncbi:MAG TPA: aldo/keto reductase [Phycisphaerae bacterium]|nr:aldo/keto reductase [Phycisphaerae bacterium]
MLKKLLIPGTSLRVSEFALGTAPWGSRTPQPTVTQLYDLYRAAGGNVLDTAHVYASWLPNGNGASERSIAQLLAARNDRRQIVLVSKGGHPTFEGYSRPDRYMDPALVRQDLRESLQRLAVDTIDLYFLHRDDPRVPVAEIIDALNDAVADGQIRYFGASNWSTARMDEANRYAAGLSHPGAEKMGFVASQPEFSLAHPNAPEPTSEPANRFLRDADLAWHQHTGMPAFCYTPAAQGYFASNGQKGAKAFDNPTSRARLARAKELAGKLRVTPAQIALAFVRNQPFPAIPILGNETPQHLQESLDAAAITLTPDQLTWLTNG